jgi:hypothetical protein
MTITNVLRKALAESAVSLREIAGATGIRVGPLRRFQKGDQTLVLDRAEVLARYFGLNLVATPPTLPKSSRTFTDKLRTAIQQYPGTRAKLSRHSGIEESALCRFVHDHRSILLDTADLLAVYLGLSLTPDPNAVPPKPTSENLARLTPAKRKAKRKAN